MELSDRFYKSTEVAEILGVSLRTLYRYMDSGKIRSVQLPSGRHRFTKQQVEEFLYANGSGGLGQVQGMPMNAPTQNEDRVYVDTGHAPMQTVNQPQMQPQAQTGYAPMQQSQQIDTNAGPSLGSIQEQPTQHGGFGIQQPAQVPAQPAYSQETVVSKPQSSFQPAQPVQTPASEEVDDLDAELEELLASLEDDTDDTDSTETSVPQEVPVQQQVPVAPQSAPEPIQVAEQPVQQQAQVPTQESSSIIDEAPVPSTSENTVSFFYCPYNQLRAIARMVKGTSEDNDKKYAFTMNAGLSLYAPLDPFSVIHFYIEESDLDFWKDNLQLRESTQSDANIGLLMTKGKAFDNLNEVSGLNVVSKSVMIENLKANGQDNLVNMAESKM